MGKYGDVAEAAAKLMSQHHELHPRNAWNRAAEEIFPDSPSGQAKSCPRNTFLGLCEIGAVRSVPPGSYTRSIRNKEYATRALAALRSDPTLVEDERRLWAIATESQDLTPNSQMDVVKTLWQSDRLR